jgi:hypothetical protein
MAPWWIVIILSALANKRSKGLDLVKKDCYRMTDKSKKGSSCIKH